MEIKSQGDTVNIRRSPVISVHDHERGEAFDPDVYEFQTTQLVIDYAKRWSFEVDDVDDAQADLEYMKAWTKAAGEAMTEAVNETVLQSILADIDTSNKGPGAGVKSGFFNFGEVNAPVQITPANAISYLSQMGAVLTEAKVPSENRYAVLPPWFEQTIYESPFNTALIQGGNEELFRKGYIGDVSGLKLYRSNQIFASTDDMGTAGDTTDDVNAYNVIFGHTDGLTFASQLTNTETMRAERKFATLVRGLMVFGFKVIRPEYLGLLYCTRGS